MISCGLTALHHRYLLVRADVMSTLPQDKLLQSTSKDSQNSHFPDLRFHLEWKAPPRRPVSVNKDCTLEIYGVVDAVALHTLLCQVKVRYTPLNISSNATTFGKMGNVTSVRCRPKGKITNSDRLHFEHHRNTPSAHMKLVLEEKLASADALKTFEALLLFAKPSLTRAPTAATSLSLDGLSRVELPSFSVDQAMFPSFMGLVSAGPEVGDIKD